MCLLWHLLPHVKPPFPLCAHGYKCEHDKGKKKGQGSMKKVSGTPGKNGKISGTGKEESQGVNSL